MPDAGGGEAFIGIDVQIEARNTRRLLAAVMKKMHAEVCLVRRFIAGETGVAMNAEERAAGRARIGDQMLGDAREARLKIADELQDRSADTLLVTRFVFREPFAIVVFLQLAQKREDFGCHGTILSRRSSSSSFPCAAAQPSPATHASVAGIAGMERLNSTSPWSVIDSSAPNAPRSIAVSSRRCSRCQRRSSAIISARNAIAPRARPIAPPVTSSCSAALCARLLVGKQSKA